MPKFDLQNYEPVEDRLENFHKDFEEGRVITEMVAYSDDRVVFKASLFRSFDEEKPWATGYAEETRGEGGLVNITSHLENCETSAIGRALANAGYATKGKRPSREEMMKVRSRLSEIEEAKGAQKTRVRGKESQAKEKKQEVKQPELINESRPVSAYPGVDEVREIKRLYAITAKLHPRAQNIGQRVMQMAKDKGYESLNKVPKEELKAMADNLEGQLSG